jgi:hypothetical protein
MRYGSEEKNLTFFKKTRLTAKKFQGLEIMFRHYEINY